MESKPPSATAAGSSSRFPKPRELEGLVERLLAMCALAALYVVAARVGLALHHRGEIASLIWAPTGISLAAVLLYGIWLWPAVAVGAFVSMVSSGWPAHAGIWVAYAEVTEIILAFYLLRHVAHMHAGLDRVRDVISLVIVGITTSLIAASITTGGFALAELLPGPRLPVVWSTIWWGHLSADLMVAPLFLTWSRRSMIARLEPAPRRAELVVLVVLLCLVTAVVVNGWFPGWLGRYAPYYLLPLLLWTAVRFGPFGAAAANFLVDSVMILGASFGLSLDRELSDLQSFIAISSVTGLTLSALALERMRAVQLKAAILRGALDAIITLDAEDCVVEFNPAAERLFGYREGEILGKPFGPRVVLPELRGAYRELLEAHLHMADHDVNRIRSFAVRADGTTFPVEVAITRIPIDDRVLVTGFVRDVTREQIAEAERRESHELLSRSVDQQTAELVKSNAELERREALLRRAEALAHLGSFEIDLQTNSLKWSDELYRIHGRDPRSFAPTYDDFLACVHPDDRLHIASVVARALREQTPFSFTERIVRPDGTVRVLQAQAEVFVDADGHAVRVSGCCQDVTERKQAEAARDRLVELIESSEDAIIGLTPEGTIESWNPGASRLFGYPAGDVVGQSYQRLVPAENTEEVTRTIELVLAGNHLTHGEMVHTRADGSQFDASVTVSAIVEPSGRVIGISKVLRDITAKKAAEAQLVTSLREKEVLLREIHHRVKNNLQVISSLLNLQVAQEPSDAGRRGLQESQSRVQSMALVHQLLYQSKDFSHIDLGQYLQGLALRLVQTYQLAPGKVEIAVTSPTIKLDIDRAIPCGLIVNELVTNSLSHAFPDDRHGRIWLTVTEDGRQIVLTVRDDGIGLPPEVRIDSTRTFGLQIANTLTRQLGGTIELAGGAGTTVTISIPMTARTTHPETP